MLNLKEIQRNVRLSPLQFANSSLALHKITQKNQKMKKIITSVVALLVMGSVSFAQDAPKTEKKKSVKKTETTTETKDGTKTTKTETKKMDKKDDGKTKSKKKTETTTETKAK